MDTKMSIDQKMTISCRKAFEMISSGRGLSDCQQYLVSQLGFGFPKVTKDEFKRLCLAYIRIGERNGY